MQNDIRLNEKVKCEVYNVHVQCTLYTVHISNYFKKFLIFSPMIMEK